MALHTYGKIFRRRWLLAILPAVVVAILGLMTYSPPPVAFNGGMRFIVGQAPSDAAAASDEERLANWQTSEYIVNGLTDWSLGGQFAELVSARLEKKGLDVPAGAIQGSIAADNTRSMMTLSMTFGDAALLTEMLNAAAETLIEDNALGVPQLGGEPAQLVQLDQPIVNQISAGIFDQLQLPFRLAVAIGVGIAFALLVEYLDPTIHDRDELENLGLVVMGEIPKR